jgi:hypothetical protein
MNAKPNYLFSLLTLAETRFSKARPHNAAVEPSMVPGWSGSEEGKAPETSWVRQSLRPLPADSARAPWAASSRTRFSMVVANALLLGSAAAVRAQLPPELVNRLNSSVPLSVAATTVLAGGSGARGGSFSSSTSAVDADLNLAKFGGSGDIGDPRPLGLFGMKWQPRLQGDIGYLTLENHFNTGLLAEDRNEYDTFAVEFGGGARFWFDDHLSLAPTISAIYGHTKNDFTANSSFSQANYDAAVRAGLINWNVDTWTIVPGAELAYLWTWKRTTFTLSSTYTFFHTQDFHSSSSVVDINSNSQTWENKLDVDVPTGMTLFNRELHVGGYYSWTGFYGDLSNGFSESGLDVNHVNEVHGRVVLDYLNKLWKVKWLGVGASYFWGEHFNGWSVGADVAFKF